MKESLTENPHLLRDDDGISPKMALELRTELNKFRRNFFNKAATGSPVIVTHCDGSVRYTDIVHKAAFREEAVN